MKKVRRMLAGVIIVSALASGIWMTAGAANQYTFAFNPPFYGCADYTGVYHRDGNRAYVFPLYDTAKTTYCLLKPDGPEATAVVSTYVKTGDYGRNDFTYLIGRAEAPNVKMMGYPTSTNFLPYVVGGEWQQ